MPLRAYGIRYTAEPTRGRDALIGGGAFPALGYPADLVSFTEFEVRLSFDLAIADHHGRNEPQNPLHPIATPEMGEGDWKNKLTAEQLERKRLGDREKQRLRRKQHKDSAEQLDSKLSLLLAKHESEAVRALFDENAALRAETEHLRAQLSKIFRLTAELPYQDATMLSSTPHTPHTETPSESSGSKQPMAELQGSILRHQSVLRQVAKAALCADGSAPQLSSVDGLIDSVLGWKLMAGHALGLAFLADRPLDQQFQDLHILDSETFYGGLVAAVNEGRTEFSPNAVIPVETPNSTLPDLELQDRCIALYAYSLTGSWLAKLPSKFERTVHFWVAYSLCKFWAFPTQKNFERIPHWMYPVPAQFYNDHPGYIDFLPWPSLRTYLATHGGEYDVYELYTKLTETQAFTFPQPSSDFQPLFYDRFYHALVLDDEFMLAMWDIRNLRPGVGFTVSHPELFNLIHTDYSISNVMGRA